MTFSLQVVVIALLVAFLVGILIGYALVQGRLQRQSEALEENQRRLAELEASYEVRLKETTQKLRRDYEAELAETIEHYQDQLSDKTLELKQNYETRLGVLQQGLAETAISSGVAMQSRTAEPSLSQPEMLHLKRQYELRLKEAAQKLQQAYEKQLAQHAKSVTAELQADYEKRITEKVEHYDQQFAQRQTQLEQEYRNRLNAINTTPESKQTDKQTYIGELEPIDLSDITSSN